MHRDVYASYSWSVNMNGCKVWLFISPKNAHLLKHAHRNEWIYNILSDPKSIDLKQFPHFLEAQKSCIVVKQYAGEAIFVPSAWFHQVYCASHTYFDVHYFFILFRI